MVSVTSDIRKAMNACVIAIDTQISKLEKVMV